MNVYPLNNLIEFSPSQHTKHVFFEREKVKAQVVTLDSGQKIPPCRMDHDVIFVVLEGNGKIVVDGENTAIEKFSFVFIPKEKESRSLEAETKMIVLAIQVKS